jgi:dTDP-4-dehydrorhamnose reductase
MKVLILGGSGMLGHQLWRVLSSRFDTKATLRRLEPTLASLFDPQRITTGVAAEDFDSVVRAIAKTRPTVVVNCIGIVKQQGAAKDPVPCLTVNSLFPHRLAQLCQAAGARLIHVSTDCVFSGKKGNYTETDPSDAEDLYGRSKLMGEVQGPGCLTLRTSIIGRELQTKQGLIEWFLSNVGRSVAGYRNAIFSGLTTAALSELIAQVIEKWPQLEGLYHVAAEPISKFELLKLVRSVFRMDITIVPDDAFRCDRSLCAAKFKQATGWTARPWPEMIADLRKEDTVARAA